MIRKMLRIMSSRETLEFGTHKLRRRLIEKEKCYGPLIHNSTCAYAVKIRQSINSPSRRRALFSSLSNHCSEAYNKVKTGSNEVDNASPKPTRFKPPTSFDHDHQSNENVDAKVDSQSPDGGLKMRKLPSLSQMMHTIEIQRNNEIPQTLPDRNYHVTSLNDVSNDGRLRNGNNHITLVTTDIHDDEASEPTTPTKMKRVESLKDKPKYRETFNTSNPITISVGSIAQQCDGSALVTSGGTTILSTVVREKGHSFIPCSDFFPMTVEYRERYHAVGMIPTGRNRRDNSGPPTTDEILAARAIDRALRPLLPSEMYHKDDSIQIMCSVQSHNKLDGSRSQVPECSDPVALAINTASAALVESGMPFNGPAACVRVCLTKDGEIVKDPSPGERRNSLADLLYAGTEHNILMIEFFSKAGETISPRKLVGLPEDEVLKLIEFAHSSIQDIIKIQQKIKVRSSNESDFELLQKAREMLGLSKSQEVPFVVKISDESANAFQYVNEALSNAAYKHFSGKDFDEKYQNKRYRGLREKLLLDEVSKVINEKYPSHTVDERKYLAEVSGKKLFKQAMQKAALDNTRSDSRSLDSIRPIHMEVPIFPNNVHGSSCFSRGDTQVISTVTLGAPKEGLPMSGALSSVKLSLRPSNLKEEKSDSPVGSLRSTKNEVALLSDLNSRKVVADRESTGDSGTFHDIQRAFLHYDFPLFATGEVRNVTMRTGRREIGHGSLAERAILSALPPIALFPYSIRITSEVTSSNGSSSMATVCGSTLALLDAGVRLLSPIAGISVGLIVREDVNTSPFQNGNYAILVDITGTEDYYGEMDLKVAGSCYGITAIQLDVKYRGGIPLKVLAEALSKAEIGRHSILKDMKNTEKGGLSELLPRSALKQSAPRVEVIRFDPVRKRDLIGPGGAVLKQLEECFDVSLDLSQEGQCLLHGTDAEMVSKAKSVVMDLVADVEEGGIYDGVVIEVKDFGAIVELLRNKEGLLHVSEMTDNQKLLSHPDGNLGIVKSLVRVGDRIRVVCIGVDPIQGLIKLSRKQLDENDPLHAYSALDAFPRGLSHADDLRDDPVAESRNEDWVINLLRPNQKLKKSKATFQGKTNRKQKRRKKRKYQKK